MDTMQCVNEDGSCLDDLGSGDDGSGDYGSGDPGSGDHIICAEGTVRSIFTSFNVLSDFIEVKECECGDRIKGRIDTTHSRGNDSSD